MPQIGPVPASPQNIASTMGSWMPLAVVGKMAALVTSIWLGTKVVAAMTNSQKAGTSDASALTSKRATVEKLPEKEEASKELTRFQKCKQKIGAIRASVIATAEAHPRIAVGMAGSLVTLALWSVRRQITNFPDLHIASKKKLVLVKDGRPPSNGSGRTGKGDPKGGDLSPRHNLINKIVNKIDSQTVMCCLTVAVTLWRFRNDCVRDKARDVHFQTRLANSLAAIDQKAEDRIRINAERRFEERVKRGYIEEDEMVCVCSNIFVPRPTYRDFRYW